MKYRVYEAQEVTVTEGFLYGIEPEPYGTIADPGYAESGFFVESTEDKSSDPWHEAILDLCHG